MFIFCHTQDTQIAYDVPHTLGVDVASVDHQKYREMLTLLINFEETYHQQ